MENPIKYAGEYYDEEPDMYYLRARYYDPNVGRFTSLDIKEGEISNPLDMNRYVYCRNNPIKYIDPSGEAVVLSTAAIGYAVMIGVKVVVDVAAYYAGVNDPYARPNQKKQGRERKEKKKNNGNWTPNPNKKPAPLPKHTPGRGHRKY